MGGEYIPDFLVPLNPDPWSPLTNRTDGTAGRAVWPDGFFRFASRTCRSVTREVDWNDKGLDDKRVGSRC